MKSESKIAIVTGAGTGIGRSTTISLLREGYSVVLAGRRKEPLESTVKESGDDGSRTLVCPTDVGNPDSVLALFAQQGQLSDGWTCSLTMPESAHLRYRWKNSPMSNGKQLLT